MRANVQYRQGALASAEADAWGALAVEEWFTAPIAFLTDVLIERGALKLADEQFARHGLSGDELFPNLLVANLLLDSRGRLRCAQGRWREGLADLLAVGQRLDAWGTVNPAIVAWRSNAALAYAALGDLDSARRLSDEEVAVARAFGAPRALGVALRVAGLLGAPGRGLELLAESVSVLERSGAQLEHARALVDYGAALRRRGRRTEARELLRAGLDRASLAGATVLAAQAREELVAAGARPRRERITGADALTASERRVAALAAEGMSNREIAQALFVTIKTVKAHLGHVFAKLDVSSRSELAAALVRSEQPSSRA
jgi:DNA-binding CsgD family transcriptional regulator